MEEKIGTKYLVPLVLATKQVEEIREENLPDYPCVIKTNHDSEGVILVRDKFHVNYQDIQVKLKKRLRQNHYWGTKEWQYKNIKSFVLIERMLLTENGHIPDDFKVFCFNGKAEMIQVNIDRFGTVGSRKSDEGYGISFYNRDWEKIELKWGSSTIGGDIPRPICLDELLWASESLSKAFPFARIDFYIVQSKLFFGEITFHPTSGYVKIDEEWDLHMGTILKLPE